MNCCWPTSHFAKLCLRNASTSVLEQIATDNGMRTLWQNGVTRAVSGQTTLEETIRVLAADMM